MSPQKTVIPEASLILRDERYAHLAHFLKELNGNWQAHDGQLSIGEAIFVNGARRVLCESGRKFGKSDFATDSCWRLGNMISRGQGYYFGAYAKAVREFMWANGRLENHGPAKYIKAVNKTEMRITFTTDTFVKCEGADEFKVSKGFNPDFVVLDEFADYPDDFWYVMSPNFASKDTIVIIISSPPWILEEEPDKPVLFIRIADLWKKYMETAAKKGMKSKYMYFNMPTSTNPHISKEWLAQEKEDLIGMGLEDIYLREYEAKRVVGGGKRIIGTYNKAKHWKSHDWIIENKIKGHEEELTWLDITDPANANIFGGLIMAINPYCKEVYFLDEHYGKEENENIPHVVWPILEAKERDLYPEELNSDPERFLRIYDEAEAWFASGVLNDFGVSFLPTEKGKYAVEFGISLLRTIFRFDKGFVSDRCPWLSWELENWRKNKRGIMPDEGCHLIDCGRYGLHAADYFLKPEDRVKMLVPHPREVWQARREKMPDEETVEQVNALYGPDGGPVPNEYIEAAEGIYTCH